ncbi:unnamed protein product [Prunus brigantina]
MLFDRIIKHPLGLNFKRLSVAMTSLLPNLVAVPGACPFVTFSGGTRGPGTSSATSSVFV